MFTYMYAYMIHSVPWLISVSVLVSSFCFCGLSVSFLCVCLCVCLSLCVCVCVRVHMNESHPVYNSATKVESRLHYVTYE